MMFVTAIETLANTKEMRIVAVVVQGGNSGPYRLAGMCGQIAGL